jgi:hypothetical protein
MSLEDALKAKALALVSQQMANWVVDIQRQIGEHQGNLVRSLDELSENVARYDEKINESEIEAAVVEVLRQQPPAAAAGPGIGKLKASLAEVEKGANLSEVLTYLVNEVAGYVDRAAMFIVKGTTTGSNAIGWYARGVTPGDAIKQVSVPLSADTVFRIVHNSRHALRGHVSHSPGTGQALARLGGQPQGILAVPLILREKLAAILYCDTTEDEIAPGTADLIEILVAFAGKIIDMLSVAPRQAARVTGGSTAERAAQIRTGGDEVRERAGVPQPRAVPPPPPPPQQPPPPPAADEGSSTVMFNASSFTAAVRPPQAPAPPPPGPRLVPPPAPPSGFSPEEQKAHDDAKRFARLVVSEIKLYNEAKVNEGRRHKDIYERLKEDIERGRQMYGERVAPQVRESTNYFFDELVRILAGGDASALGPM